MRALREAGLKRFWRFAWYALADVVYRVLMLPPLQAWFLRRLGARIGADTVMIDTHFMSVNVNGFRHLEIGRECFLGNEILIDLASPIAIEDRVSIGSRSVILSHLNVGYRDHPLQPYFPRRFEGVRIRESSFIGASVTILPGVEIGPMAFVAAGSVVTESVPPRAVAAGVPARVVRRLDEPPA